jgi:hypothetical protein
MSPPPLTLRIHLKPSQPKKPVSNEAQPQRTLQEEEATRRRRPPGMSKEMRRERNRVTARESRDRKAAYVAQLESEVRMLSERVAQLEYDLTTRSIAASSYPSSFSFGFCDELAMAASSACSMLSPEQMGFFDP